MTMGELEALAYLGDAGGVATPSRLSQILTAESLPPSLGRILVNIAELPEVADLVEPDS